MVVSDSPADRGEPSGTATPVAGTSVQAPPPSPDAAAPPGGAPPAPPRPGVVGGAPAEPPGPRAEVPPPPPPRAPGAPAASRLRHPTASGYTPNWTSGPNPASSTTIPRPAGAPPNGAGSAVIPPGGPGGGSIPPGGPDQPGPPPGDGAGSTGRRAAWRQRRAAKAAALAARPTFDRRPLRYRILPRSAIGISVVILSFALGASLSGVILYTNYEYRLTQDQDKVSALTNGIPTQVKDATDALKGQEADAENLINQELAPLKSVLATGQTVQQLVTKVAPAVYFVHTLDSSGQPSVGTAFAIATNAHQTLLLTSYTTIAAATVKPGPTVYLRQGTGGDESVSVYTWDASKDLALIILPRGNLATLTFATAEPQLGERVFAVSGLGAAGAAITQGFVADVSADGIQHDATTGVQFQGGPLLDSSGLVVGVLSRTYSPLGFPVADVWFAVPPDATCAKVLVCPNGTPVQSTSGSPG